MQFFDFHVHVILKQVFAESPNIDALISRKDVATLPRCTDLPNVINSQSHQSQLAVFKDHVIIGVVLYGLESYIAKEVLPLRKNLKEGSRHKMSEALLGRIADTTATPCYPVCDEFTIGLTLEKYLAAPSSFNVLQKNSFSQPLPKDKVNIFFVIEGCHSLVNSCNETLPGNQAKHYDPQEILANLDKILDKVPVLAVNPTHIQQSNLCNHAFGMQITGDEPFYPAGDGLTDDGRTVIQGLFDRGIDVDVKHMSYLSRKQLFAEIDNGGFSNPGKIHCTHAGFTGIPFFQYPGFILRRKPVPGTNMFYLELAKTLQVENEPQRPGAPAFNMTTINLFDEEIAWIVSHGGMIGLSLDKRILGYVDPGSNNPTGIDPASPYIADREYISRWELQALGITGNYGYNIIDTNCLMMDDIEESLEHYPNDYFSDHILHHLKHYFQACYNDGISIQDAQQHITIGSDFDGMINPFPNIDTVAEIPRLKEYIRRYFKGYLGKLKDSAQWADQLNVGQFVEDLFYNNGYRYLEEFFQVK
jgi:microsomal dipeptidase-like Zn-dependent dipeptidase